MAETNPVNTLSKLPDFVIASMFGRNLMAPLGPPKDTKVAKLDPPSSDEPSPIAPVSQPVSLEWLGNFEQKILIVVNEPSHRFCADESLSLLTKILGSVRLSLADIALVNQFHAGYNYPLISKQLKPIKAIYFGVNPSEFELPLKVPDYQVQNWDDCSFVFAPSIASLNGSSTVHQEMKKNLWQSLKKLFNL